MKLQESLVATNLSEIINQEDRGKIAEGLSVFLADTYSLYLKTQNYHWNVRGMHFMTLHEMFEEQYLNLAQTVDDIAERIRALGYMSPGSFTAFQELTHIPEDDTCPDAEQMLANLLAAHELTAKSADEVLQLANNANDEATVDILVDRISYHQKTAWMLRSMLAK
jgi:starvation-inducible DNA-binding protein